MRSLTRGCLGTSRQSRLTENCVVNITFILTYPVKQECLFNEIYKYFKEIQSEYQKYKFKTEAME